MMNIRPSAAIRKNYNEISELCKRTGEPVYLTKNGSGNLVVMDIEAFARRKSMLKLKEKLMQSEIDIQKGRTYSVEETASAMRKAVAEVSNAGKNKLYTVKITETAWEMLIFHVRFLANVNVPAANRLIDTFVETADSLAVMPEHNTWLEYDAIPFQKYHKLLFGKQYTAFYQIQENTVYVTAVMNCRQDYVWLL